MRIITRSDSTLFDPGFYGSTPTPHIVWAQVLSPRGEWRDVSIPPDCVAMLPGFTLEYALDGLQLATHQRVVRHVCGNP